jgi:hypothetical protein
MPTVNISPIFNVPFIQDSDGNPLAGGLIFAYEAGSYSVLLDTYTSESGSVENSNPIVLDSSGNLPTAIWLLADQTYNLVLTAADGTTVLKGFDNVTGVPPASTGGGTNTASVWVTTAAATFLGPTQFLVPGNFTEQFKAGNRVRLTQSGSFTYGVVTTSTFSSPNTSVTIINDGPVLTSGLSVAEYSVLIAAQGETVDAGGVSYFDALPYSTTNTVGWKIKAVEGTVSSLTSLMNSRVNATYNVLSTSGTGTYTASADSAITSYSVGQSFVLKFGNASTGAATVNINGIGVKNLYQYQSNGTKINPTITAGLVSEIAYDGTDFILLDQLPAAAAGAPPRGRTVITSNTTFTVPASVYWLNVTVVGGGGGGGLGYRVSNEGGVTYFYGGGGGNGGVGVEGVTVTPGATHTVTIGSSGAAATTGSSAAGGSTTFGASLAVATGGSGGQNASGSSNGSPGANGTSTASDFSIAGASFAVGGAPKGTGGSGGDGESGGSSGTPGLCIVEW